MSTDYVKIPFMSESPEHDHLQELQKIENSLYAIRKPLIDARKDAAEIHSVLSALLTRTEAAIAAVVLKKTKASTVSPRDGMGSKSYYVRSLLVESPGMTGAQLIQRCEGVFEKLPASFPYSLLGHWIKTGSARKDDNGRYYLIEKSVHSDPA